MAVHEELEAILARLQQMRQELRLEVSAGEPPREETTGAQTMPERVGELGSGEVRQDEA